MPNRSPILALALAAVSWPLLACGPSGAEASSDSMAAAQATCPVRESVNPSSSLPYSAAVKAGNTVYFAGKIGATQETRAMTEGRVAAETRNIMEAFSALFDEMGMGFEDVVKGTVYLDNIEDYAEMNGVYGEYFPSDPPARVALSVDQLPGNAALEIEFISVCR